jgi:hypothetical protein
MKRIVWIASYPKSGNTWIRALLTALTRDRQVDVNRLVAPIASSRVAFEEESGVDASDLLPDEIDRLRPEVYRAMARTAGNSLPLKVHDAFVAVDGLAPPFPADCTLGTIYAVRNPLDVAVSFAAHLGRPVDDAISKMADPAAQMSASRSSLAWQLPQKLLTWSGHVESWLDQRELPVLLVRYEDLRRNPLEAFTAIARLGGWPADGETVSRAIEACRFERLQEQERCAGFHERPPGMERFFREGRAGGWRDALRPAQVERIVADHGRVMRRLGYTDERGDIL